jgi:hypothetical protein
MKCDGTDERRGRQPRPAIRLESIWRVEVLELSTAQRGPGRLDSDPVGGSRDGAPYICFDADHGLRERVSRILSGVLKRVAGLYYHHSAA